VNWQNHHVLAAALRDQGLADVLAGKFCLRGDEFSISGVTTTLGHVAVGKCQQGVEKVTKGYLLRLSGAYDPAKGHKPFTTALEQYEDLKKPMKRLLQSLNRANSRLVAELKWLESLAPARPKPPDPPAGVPVAAGPQPLHIIPMNSEYPFWTGGPVDGSLSYPAAVFVPRNFPVRAFKTARTYIEILAGSEPDDFCQPLRNFLNHYPFSTELGDWPKKSD